MAENSNQETKACPYCGETILAAAKKCRFCRTFLDGTATPTDPAMARTSAGELGQAEVPSASATTPPEVEMPGETAPLDSTGAGTALLRPPVGQGLDQEVPHVPRRDQPLPKVTWKDATVSWKHTLGAIVGLLLIMVCGVGIYDEVHGRLVSRRHQEQAAQLYEAVRNGQIETVRALLEKGADPNAAVMRVIYAAQPAVSITPLFQAADDGHTEIVKLLLERGADPNANEFPPLSAAANKGHVEIVKLLLGRGGNPNDALGWAAMAGRVDVVKLLLEEGADPNTKVPVLGPVLIAAAGSNQDVEVIRLLLEKGADMSAVEDELGENALMAAVDSGHAGIVRLLLERGADPNVGTIGDMTVPPLTQAAGKGHIEVVRVLIEKGADPNARISRPGEQDGPTAWDGKTAMILAAWNGHAEVVKLLIEEGADVNAAQKNGNTALMVASERGHADCVELLMQAHGDTRWDPEKTRLARIARLNEANEGARGSDDIRTGGPAEINSPTSIAGGSETTMGIEGAVPGSKRSTSVPDCTSNTLSVEPETKFYSKLEAGGLQNLAVVNICWQLLPKGAKGRIAGMAPAGTATYRIIIEWGHGRIDTFSKNNVQRLFQVVE